MKISIQTILLVTCALVLSGCLFKEPIFNEGFAKVDPALGGVWAADGEGGDPRKTEFAVCVPLDADRYLLHYPGSGKDATYYEARPLQVRGRSLLQLRILATFGEGLPQVGAERFTLLWIENDAAGSTIKVRALGGAEVKEQGSAALKKLLDDPVGDWSKVFGETMIFRRLKDA